MRSRKVLLLVGLVSGLTMVTGCGRSRGLGLSADGGRPPVADTMPHLPDGLVLPDGLNPPPPPPPTDLGPLPPDVYVPPPPPPPPMDFGPWPTDVYVPPPPPPNDLWPWPTDGLWPPPPPKDIWPPPPPKDFGPPPPPTDMFPPLPDTGPCAPTCTQMCQVLMACGLYTGSYAECTKACTAWPASQVGCLTKLICSGVSSCLTYGTCLAPAKQPDLVVSGFSAKVSGSDVSYAIKVCNNGQGSAGAFYLDLYYNRTSPPGAKLVGEKYLLVSGLAGGQCMTQTFTRTNTPAGTYSSWAQVDTDGAVTESNENNNVRGPIKVTVKSSPPPPVKKPDLQIQAMFATVYGYTSPYVRYQVEVCNHGAVASPATTLDLYFDAKAKPKAAQKGDQSTSVPALQPGGCTFRYVYWTNVPGGTFNTYAQVDVPDNVDESNENNNVYGPTKVVVGSQKGADLRVTVFNYQVYTNGYLLYRVEVCNAGTGASGITDVHVYFNQTQAPKKLQKGDASTTVPILQPGTCSSRYIYRPNTPNGKYSSWVQVDPMDAVPETNENNNVRGPLAVQVGSPNQQPDLVIGGLKASVNGSTVTYDAQVCNKGNGPATPFRVDFYYNRSFQPSVGQTGDTYVTVPQLGVGQCTNITRNRSNVSAGIYRSWVQADTAGWVSESNENNNIGGPTVVTVVPQPVACAMLCAFAVQCGLFSATQAQQCLAWCNGLNSAHRQCASQAMATMSCSALKQCNLPPPPPPPPPPNTCPNLCTWFINSCKLLPQSQYWTCVGACQNLPTSKLNCAINAQKNNQCYGALQCIL